MSNHIFESNVSYSERFIKNQCKQIKFPNFKYLDAKLHPKYKDHIVVLSSNQFPENVEMTSAWEAPFNGLKGIDLDTDENYKSHFKAALDEVETLIMEEKSSEKKVDSKNLTPNSKTPPSSHLESANALLEETKGLGLNVDSDSGSGSSDYEGGEGDEESEEEPSEDETEKKKNKNKNKKDKKKDDKKKADKKNGKKEEKKKDKKEEKKKDKKEEKKKKVVESEQSEQSEQSEDEESKEEMEKEMDSILQEDKDSKKNEKKDKKDKKGKKGRKEAEEDVLKEASRLIDSKDLSSAQPSSDRSKIKDKDQKTEDLDSEEEEKTNKKTKKDKKVKEKADRKSSDKKVKPDKTKVLPDEEHKSKQDKLTEDEQSNTEDKDEKVTNIPKEEVSNKASESHKDEEENDDPNANKNEFTNVERFNKLNKKYKQMVIDLAVDMAYDTNPAFKFRYHGYTVNESITQESVADKLAIPGYSVPDTEKINLENTTYIPSDYQNWSTKSPYEGIEYKPPIIREKFQISLWRVDNVSCVKTKDRYFSINNPRFVGNNTGNFKINFSNDKDTITLVEVPEYGQNNKHVVILDAFSLKKLSEQEIEFCQPDLKVPDADEYYDEYQEDYSSHYTTSANAISLMCWNKGKYLLYAVKKPNLVAHYQYELFDTEKQRVVKVIKRDGELKDVNIKDIRVDPENKDVLYFA